MPNLQPSATFPDDLRRVVIFSTLLSDCCEFLQQNIECPAPIASAAQDMRKAKDRLLKVMMRLCPNSTQMVINELTEDRVSDLLSLLDESIDVKNVDDILTLIRENKS